MMAFKLIVLPFPGGYRSAWLVREKEEEGTYPEEDQSPLPGNLKVLVRLLRLVKRSIIPLESIFEFLI
jgi:hypothetical protein